MRSVMTHQFSQVPEANIQRSSFDRSHGYKTTFNAGQLIPIFVDEALPGDTFSLRMQGFARMATPLFPFMDNVFMETFFFSVPHRLLWDNWEKFCGAQDDPGDSTDFTIPQLANFAAGYSNSGLYDYFGIPTAIANTDGINALPFRAYNLIWNEWFRDQNFQNSLTVPTDNGPDPVATYNLKNRGKRHDYFTSCLPWPQKGDSVDIPLGATAPIIRDESQPYPHFNIDNDTAARRLSGDAGSDVADWNATLTGTGDAAWSSSTGATSIGLVADLTDATAATINQLRQAFQIQKLLERDARGGTRYTEVIRAHFGVTSPDARLQRPEFLGGGSTRINTIPVPQTSETGSSPQGNLSAYATASLDGHGFRKSFTEHCVLIGLVAVRADLTYQQGLPRMWSRQTRFDYYWPALAHIGEQAVLNREIYYQGTADDENVFGYQERFAEYRYKQSQITGKFRSNAAGTLDAWHLSQDFAALPTLGDTFIQENPPIDRVVAVPAEPQFLFDSYFNMRCARPMPLYGVPGNMDRF